MKTPAHVLNGNLEISDFLNEIDSDWQASQNSFPKNVIHGEYWPIPFFGNPATARVATIGVNPSSEEFSSARHWPRASLKNRGVWKKRLKSYFNSDLEPDDWFDPWTISLALLDCSYEAGTAAHFDVSYRPTKAMLKNPKTERKEFGRMVERDVKWLFKLLPLCPNLRVLLTMGPIIGKDGQTMRLIEFLSESAPHHGFKVVQMGKFLGLRNEATGKHLILHEADMPDEKCITCRVVKSIHLFHDELRERITWQPKPALF
jgi:hypothetical protein